MGMRVSFELNDDDLQHFRLIMRETRKATATAAPEDIVAAAEQLLSEVQDSKVPHFVRERLDKLQIMIGMLDDHEWRLPQRETNRVLNALAYFCDPEDLIPDNIPGLGFLDDAIMIELVVRDLKHEIDAYNDFRNYRSSRAPVVGVKSRSRAVSPEEWLEQRRKELQSRMRRRRMRGAQSAKRNSDPKVF